MTTFRDYQNALNERESFDIGSVGFRAAQQKIDQIVEELLKDGNRKMACEIADTIDSLYGFWLENSENEELTENIRHLVEIMQENGFDELIDEEWEEV